MDRNRKNTFDARCKENLHWVKVLDQLPEKYFEVIQQQKYLCQKMHCWKAEGTFSWTSYEQILRSFSEGRVRSADWSLRPCWLYVCFPWSSTGTGSWSQDAACPHLSNIQPGGLLSASFPTVVNLSCHWYRQSSVICGLGYRRSGFIALTKIGCFRCRKSPISTFWHRYIPSRAANLQLSASIFSYWRFSLIVTLSEHNPADNQGLPVSPFMYLKVPVKDKGKVSGFHFTTNLILITFHFLWLLEVLNMYTFLLFSILRDGHKLFIIPSRLPLNVFNRCL